MLLKEEFVKMCQVCGYASKKNANAYAERKKELNEELTEKDFEIIHRYNERKLDMEKIFQRTCKSTGEQLINSLSKNPRPWNRVFDASRGANKRREENR